MAMRIQNMPLGAWEPDIGVFGGQHATEARNVVPIKGGYKSMPSVAPYSSVTALPDSAKALAAHAFKSFDDDLILVVAADDGKIYALESGAWVQKYSGSSSVTSCYFAEYGEDIYALHGTTLLRGTVTSGAVGTFTAVSGAPTGSVLGVIKDFLWVGREDGYEGRVHWSALDDPTTWPTIGSDDAQAKQSDIQTFPQGGKVQAIVGAVGAADGLIFTERAVHLASYIGSPYIFSFKEIDHTAGLLAPKSPVVVNSMCVYLSAEGWMITDGTATKPIGLERVDRWFFDTAKSTRVQDVQGCYDNVHRYCIWRFASEACPDGKFDRVLIYSTQLDRWAYGTVDTQVLFNDYARSKTLEDLDALGTLDSLNFSLDDQSLRGGRSILACFDGSSKLGAFSGAPLEAVVETGEFGGNKMMLHGVRPYVDRGDAKGQVVFRDRQSDAPKFGTLRTQSRDGVCYSHCSASYARGRVVIPAGGSAWRDTKGMHILYELEGGL